MLGHDRSPMGQDQPYKKIFVQNIKTLGIFVLSHIYWSTHIFPFNLRLLTHIWYTNNLREAWKIQRELTCCSKRIYHHIFTQNLKVLSIWVLAYKEGIYEFSR